MNIFNQFVQTKKVNSFIENPEQLANATYKNEINNITTPRNNDICYYKTKNNEKKEIFKVEKRPKMCQEARNYNNNNNCYFENNDINEIYEDDENKENICLTNFKNTNTSNNSSFSNMNKVFQYDNPNNINTTNNNNFYTYDYSYNVNHSCKLPPQVRLHKLKTISKTQNMKLKKEKKEKVDQIRKELKIQKQVPDSTIELLTDDMNWQNYISDLKNKKTREREREESRIIYVLESNNNNSNSNNLIFEKKFSNSNFSHNYTYLENENISKVYSKEFFSDCFDKKEHWTTSKEEIEKFTSNFENKIREEIIKEIQQCAIRSHLSHNTYYLAVMLVDRLLIETYFKEEINIFGFNDKNAIKKVAVTCVFISSKFHDKHPISSKSLINYFQKIELKKDELVSIEQKIMRLIGFDSLIYYSIYDYIKLYFIDFKVCNKDSYDSIFNCGKDSHLFIDFNKESNMLCKLEEKAIEIALFSSNIIELNQFKLYEKGLAILIYSFDVIKQNFKYSSNQSDFISEWINFLLQQAETVFKLKKKSLEDIYEYLKNFFSYYSSK